MVHGRKQSALERGCPLAFLFYKTRSLDGPATGTLPTGLTLEFWRPQWLRPLPRGFGPLPFLGHSLLHFLGIFRSRDFAIVIIREGDAEVHHTCLFPAYFRFPFMDSGDLQAAGIWTRPDHRGQGLGGLALQEAFRRHPGRTFWYMVRQDNRPSIRLAEKSGFQFAGRGDKFPLPGLAALGLAVLGTYRITEGLNPRPGQRDG